LKVFQLIDEEIEEFVLILIFIVPYLELHIAVVEVPHLAFDLLYVLLQKGSVQPLLALHLKILKIIPQHFDKVEFLLQFVDLHIVNLGEVHKHLYLVELGLFLLELVDLPLKFVYLYFNQRLLLQNLVHIAYFIGEYKRVLVEQKRSRLYLNHNGLYRLRIFELKFVFVLENALFDDLQIIVQVLNVLLNINVLVNID